MNKIFKQNIAALLTIVMVFTSCVFVLALPKRVEAVLGVGDVGVTYNPIDYALQAAKWSWEKISNVFQQGTLSTSAVANTATAAATVAEKTDHWATMAIKIVLEAALNKLLSMMTNDIVSWVNNGFDGKPAFLTGSFGDYLSDAADQAGGDFVTQYLGAGWLCDEFDTTIKIALLEEHTFKTESKCTLSDIGVNLKNFYNDFSTGGWKGWLATTAPQNNFYSALLMAQSEKEKVAREATESAAQEAGAGEGYLNIKDCTWHDDNNQEIEVQKNVRGTPSMPEKCVKESLIAQYLIKLPCKPTCVTKTLASTVQALTNKAIMEPIERTSNSLASLAGQGGSLFKPYIMAIGNALVNQLIEKGLSQLTPSGPSSKNPNAALSAGEKIREMPDLPGNTRKEMIPVLTMEQNLELALRGIQAVRASQQKLSFLVREIKTSNEPKGSYPAGSRNELARLLAYKDAFTDYFKDWLKETPSPYKPSEIFRQFDYLQPLLIKVNNFRLVGYNVLTDVTINNIWKDYCKFPSPPDKYDYKFFDRTRAILNYFLTPYDNEGVMTKRIDIAEYDYEIDDVSSSTVETFDAAGTLIKTVETDIQKESGNYPFGINNLIDEGLFSSESTITTRKIGELVTKDIQRKDSYGNPIGGFDLTTLWQDKLPDINYGRPTATYSWIDWFVDITDQQGNSIDTTRRSSGSEVVSQIETVLADFVSRYENASQQTGDLSLIIEDALDYFDDEYVPAIEDYLDIYDENIEVLKQTGTYNEITGEIDGNSSTCLNEPKCLEIVNAERDMLEKKTIAISKVKEIYPYKDIFGTKNSENAFQSDDFDDLNDDIKILSEKIVQEEIKLSQMVGNEDHPSENSLQGFVNALDEIGPLLSEMYYQCKIGFSPFDYEQLGDYKFNAFKVIW